VKPRIEHLTPAREREAAAFLARDPYANVFLTYLVLYDLVPATRNAIRLAIDEDDAICGVGFFSRQTALAAEDDATIEAFAGIGHSGDRMIFGPRLPIAKYWDLVKNRHPLPRAIRDRQFVMMLDRSMLKPYEKIVLARRARIDEWPAVADNSASMIAVELDYDPMRSSPEFTSNVRTMIDRGLWWVGDSLGRLCFFCNVGPWSAQTAQMQGIWTPPELRGKGLATASLGAICDRLLDVTPTLSLYVNDFNTKAVALYERVGFTTTSEFQTLLF
jgi:uncharacterized protein